MPGLAFWILYFITGWAGLAWAAVILLLPVAGLGMAVVTLGLPDPGGRHSRCSLSWSMTPLKIAGELPVFLPVRGSFADLTLSGRHRAKNMGASPGAALLRHKQRREEQTRWNTCLSSN
jgi:hypothetical protein